MKKDRAISNKKNSALEKQHQALNSNEISLLMQTLSTSFNRI